MMKRYNTKYHKKGQFQFGDLKKKLNEITRSAVAPPLIQMKQIKIDQSKEDEEDRDFYRFDASLSPNKMAQLKRNDRYCQSSPKSSRLQRCFSQSSPLKIDKLLKSENSAFGFQVDKAYQRKLNYPCLVASKRSENINNKLSLLLK